MYEEIKDLKIEAHEMPVLALSMSKDGYFIASGSKDKSIKVPLNRLIVSIIFVYVEYVCMFGVCMCVHMCVCVCVCVCVFVRFGIEYPEPL